MRKLVEAGFPEHVTKAVDAGIIGQFVVTLSLVRGFGIGVEIRLQFVLSIDNHAANLPTFERLTIFPDASMPKKARAAVPADQAPQYKNDRQENWPQKKGENHVKKSFAYAGIYTCWGCDSLRRCCRVDAGAESIRKI